MSHHATKDRILIYTKQQKGFCASEAPPHPPRTEARPPPTVPATRTRFSFLLMARKLLLLARELKASVIFPGEETCAGFYLHLRARGTAPGHAIREVTGPPLLQRQGLSRLSATRPQLPGAEQDTQQHPCGHLRLSSSSYGGWGAAPYTTWPTGRPRFTDHLYGPRGQADRGYHVTE